MVVLDGSSSSLHASARVSCVSLIMRKDLCAAHTGIYIETCDIKQLQVDMPTGDNLMSIFTPNTKNAEKPSSSIVNRK